jgi:DNA-binding transcriptional regulator YbjK
MTEVKRTYLKKSERRDQILSAAVSMALETGFNSLTRDGVAIRAGVAMGQVNHVFNTMTQLRRAVMRRAVSCAHLSIIAQGIALGDTVALNAPDGLKQKALSSLLSSEG